MIYNKKINKTEEVFGKKSLKLTQLQVNAVLSKISMLLNEDVLSVGFKYFLLSFLTDKSYENKLGDRVKQCAAERMFNEMNAKSSFFDKAVVEEYMKQHDIKIFDKSTYIAHKEDFNKFVYESFQNKFSEYGLKLHIMTPLQIRTQKE